MIRRTVFILFFCLSLFAVARFCHHQTKGFRISKIKNNTYPVYTNTSGVNFYVSSLLQQKYYYLDRGLQSFSFISEDGKTVLKILNNRYQDRLFWLNLFSLPPPFEKWRLEKIAVAKTKLHRNFLSYKIAYEQLKEETGLIFFHAFPDQLKQKARIVDNIGIEHCIDLNTTAFLIQKKATLFYPYLSQLKEKGDTEKAKQALSALLKFCVDRYKKGIGDNDALIRTNFGFCQGKPMQIDVGPFYLDPVLKNPSSYKEEIHKMSLSLSHWLQEHYPELSTTLDELLQSL